MVAPSAPLSSSATGSRLWRAPDERNTACIAGMTTGRAIKAKLIRLLLIRLAAGLHQIEAVLDLAEQPGECLALLGRKAGQDLLLPVQQARDQLLVERAALAGQAQPKLAAIVLVLDALDEASLQQRGNGAADSGFVRPRAVRNVLRAAGVVTEAQRCQHAPFRNVESVALLILGRQCAAHFGRETVQPERHEAEEVEPGGSLPLRRRGNRGAIFWLGRQIPPRCGPRGGSPPGPQFARRRSCQKSLQSGLTNQRSGLR